MNMEDQVTRVLAMYGTCYRNRYGYDCLPHDSASRTAVRDMCFSYGMERVLKIVETYLKHDGGEKRYYVERGHDLHTMKKDAAKLWAAETERAKPIWVVGRDRQGNEILSSNPDELKGTPYYVKPIPYRGTP